MEPWWWWWHGMGFMWVFPTVFLVVCLVFLFMFFLRGPFSRHGEREDRRESASEILDRRFARGEITKEQYEDMKRTLRGG